MSALHNFIRAENNIQGLRELLRGGENPNSRHRRGHTSLHIAVLKSQRFPQETDDLLLVVRELICYGADVEARSNWGKTPLHLAVACRNCKIIETLLLCNADINQTDNTGCAVLHFATTVRYFRGNVVYDPDLEVIKLLLKYKPELDVQNRKNETALMLAVENNNLYIVRELLKNKASVDLQNSDGDSVMHYALKRSDVNLNIVLELFRHRGSLIHTNNIGLSPMIFYFWSLLTAPLTEVEKAKFVFKLYVLHGYILDSDEKLYIREISFYNSCELLPFIELCEFEIKQMKADSLTLNRSVYTIALRGAFCGVAENIKHIPHEALDVVINKLIRREYPVYCDLIAAGVCSPYMNEKFVKVCSSVEIGNKSLNDGVLYPLSLYLSHFDMLNMMIACFERRSVFWYLPRFISNRCSVS